MNMIKTPTNLKKVSDLLQVISPEPRLEILLGIGTGEACVCHLEAMLGLRQATLSQHLMALREAGVVTDRRDGKYIYYRLERPEIMEMVELAARLLGLEMSAVVARASTPRTPCECPKCSLQKE